MCVSRVSQHSFKRVLAQGFVNKDPVLNAPCVPYGNLSVIIAFFGYLAGWRPARQVLGMPLLHGIQ